MERLQRERPNPDRLRVATLATLAPLPSPLSDGAASLIAHLRPAGNRAIASILHAPIQRQDEEAPAPDEAPAEEAPLLDAEQIADARRYYTAQPGLYTAAIITQLRTELGLDPAGGVDDALTLAVATWQATEGGGDPELAVDGKAGPRTLPRIFRGGLNVEGEGEAFGGEVQTDVVDEWATLATPDARRDRLVALVNERLATAGVPAVTPVFDTNANNAGSFGFGLWVMRIGRTRLGGDSISEDDARDIADTVYHEARHAEQWFRMAQLRASQGLGAAAIASELGIPARIARAARAAPLARGSMEAVIAQGWWNSVYGSGRASRNQVLREVNAASTARRQAQAAFDTNPTPANQTALDRAHARFDRAFAAYRNLPEENDAWATGPAAAAGITGGSPEPEPPAAPEPEAEGAENPAAQPAGSPPATEGPAHGTLPEENLPVGSAP